ncbi:TetR/AcrR family transcriptional regulator [Klenkia brasiliensis]|uniref:Transcriptional regulator, TetR family n=1 Tax=Klenkia brasiliensis TaxID=333142 RepID=A0A1G7ZNA7_9ACTN|nr:TetR/AcrR family transcriptional regulator [Klenkia brasiliensis]SDH10168.1 transcriptional regulator, TetR family [Klenkia brasiliensis]
MNPLPLPDRYSPRTIEDTGTVLTAAPSTEETGTHATVVLGELPLLRPRAGTGPAPHTRAGATLAKTRRGLLAGAAVAFAEHGLRRATMQHVAAAAGVAKATLYNHFRTKDDVVAALLEAELQRLTTLAAGLPRERALLALAEEVGGHPVLRRLAVTEPEALARLLQAADGGALAGRLGSALFLDDDTAAVVLSWLVGLVLAPGTAQQRARQAATMARVAGGPTR